MLWRLFKIPPRKPENTIQATVNLDPVYSGKAFAGLMADIRNVTIKPGTNVLFVVTGGSPALFAYRSTFETLHNVLNP